MRPFFIALVGQNYQILEFVRLDLTVILENTE